MGNSEGAGHLSPRKKVRTAHARVRRNFYSDFTAKRFAQDRQTSGAGCPPHWRTHMAKQFAQLLVSSYLLVFFALWFII